MHTPTQSQRLRAVLFRVWEQSGERQKGMDAETFYQNAMERIIGEFRQMLEPPLEDA